MARGWSLRFREKKFFTFRFPLLAKRSTSGYPHNFVIMWKIFSFRAQSPWEMKFRLRKSAWTFSVPLICTALRDLKWTSAN
ncbi:hypothetical protein GDO81_029912 [Engystomops pustulosus]|uniref:Uncharacterized protein n=1 Tax=Engystomops pustulosus TaxID=76066 RepID=A0AAV6YCJ0_ENGPU|nr:hypothetical protein GDO81_029912 [Engystomops pustulosus]